MAVKHSKAISLKDLHANSSDSMLYDVEESLVDDDEHEIDNNSCYSSNLEEYEVEYLEQ